MNIYIDIETIPGQSPLVMEILKEQAEKKKAEIVAPGNYKDPAKINEYIATKRAEIDESIENAWLKTSLDGTLGQICAFGIALNDKPPHVFSLGDEHQIIDQAFILISQSCPREIFRGEICFVGHNINKFDLRFIYQRAVINNVRLPESVATAIKHPRDFVFDTMTEWAGYGNTISQKTLCKSLGIPTKTNGIDGSKVWEYVKSGRIEEVSNYCAEDVESVRAIHKRMQGV